VFGSLAWLLAAFYAVWPSYGVAIAGLTVTVLLALLPLTLRQARSTSEMQRLQPELRRLREEHKGDRQQLNQEMVALYQRHGVNPAGGCLPSMVQLPVVLVMYRVVRGLTYHDPSSGHLAPRYL
jgi:YidC/Oxa1 family membrane protein insertase